MIILHWNVVNLYISEEEILSSCLLLTVNFSDKVKPAKRKLKGMCFSLQSLLRIFLFPAPAMIWTRWIKMAASDLLSLLLSWRVWPHKAPGLLLGGETPGKSQDKRRSSHRVTGKDGIGSIFATFTHLLRLDSEVYHASLLSAWHWPRLQSAACRPLQLIQSCMVSWTHNPTRPNWNIILSYKTIPEKNYMGA